MYFRLYFYRQNLNKVFDFTNIDQTIVLMRTMNKFSLNSIALKSCTSKDFVYKSISKYNREVPTNEKLIKQTIRGKGERKLTPVLTL